MNIRLDRTLVMKVLSFVGRPVIAIALVAMFLLFAVADAVLGDLWDQGVHLVGIMFLVLAAVLVILLACMFLFDHFLSFREFGAAIRRWERATNPKKSEDNFETRPTLEDAIHVLAMGLRSGLVFVGICILTYGALSYLDFGSG